MKTEQRLYEGNIWSNQEVNTNSQLVLAFSSSSSMKDKTVYNSLKKFYPKAEIIMISTAGEIFDNNQKDHTVSVNALTFDKTPISVVLSEVEKIEDSFLVGEKLANQIYSKELSYSLVFSDGLRINGDDLLDGIKSVFKNTVGITGGLAGNFPEGGKLNLDNTIVSLNGEINEKANVILVGFYGNAIKIGNSSVSGWSTFGMERTITKSKNNIVFELDGEPILDLYKKYLGEEYYLLPNSGLLYPLGFYKENKNDLKVRTLIGIDKKNKGVIFNGNITEGYKAFLMTGFFSKIIEGAGRAAELSLEKNNNPQFALLISCLGRRLLLKQRTEEELEEVKEILGDNCKIGGFYSYGEIGVNELNNNYQLHNQTMTIALFSEK